MKKCPFCAEQIQDQAIKCCYCREFLGKDELAQNAGVFAKSGVQRGFLILSVLIFIIGSIFLFPKKYQQQHVVEIDVPKKAADNLLSSETKPVSSETKPVSSETKPVSLETKPVSLETKPVSSETKPVSSETKPAERPKIEIYLEAYPSYYGLTSADQASLGKYWYKNNQAYPKKIFYFDTLEQLEEQKLKFTTS